jgi:hypothetical protein
MSTLIVYSQSYLFENVEIASLFLLVPAVSVSLCMFFPRIARSIMSFPRSIYYYSTVWSKIASPQLLCKTVAYEDKYKDSLKNMIDYIDANASPSPYPSQSQTKICNFVMETTPKGQAIMRYNDETSTFEYYTDSGTLSHKYLETVCRRYVIAFHCPYLYTDMDVECEKICEVQKELQKLQPQKKQKLLVKQNINKFVRIGKLSDFSMIQTVIQKPPKISFADFKKKGSTL